MQSTILLPMFEFVPKPEPDEPSPEEAAADPAVLRAEPPPRWAAAERAAEPAAEYAIGPPDPADASGP